MESFSAVYSGELAGGEGHMPFLDSLMGESLCFTRAYANGRRSIDGIPAILAAIPGLMDEAFITSPYAAMPFTSLANVLAAEGYRTSFYHGGRNGTMGFDGFARSAGFHRYVGLREYPRAQADFDGHWGVRDRPFMQFWAHQLNAGPQPFLSALLTLSSHHPYELAPPDAARFAGGTLPIHATLRYADDALRRFFATARTMPWYANTIFVITADHTADLERDGRHGDKPIDHWIPLVVHAPGRAEPARMEDVVQQIDIMPLVLQLAGHHKPFFSLGRSPLMPGPRYAVMAGNGLYGIIGEHMQLRHDGERILAIRPLNGAAVDSAEARTMERHLQAAVQ
ncbi:MAG: LTA synthase family protein, partial [Flavobacteriales bacterium]|nr:LTA synthase family protein [Flavobacteriales bacterium]